MLQFKVLCASNTFVIKLNTIYDTIFFFVSAFFPYALSQTLTLSLSRLSQFLHVPLSLSHTHTLTHTLSPSLSRLSTVSFSLVSSPFLKLLFSCLSLNEPINQSYSVTISGTSSLIFSLPAPSFPIDLFFL